MSPYAYLMTIKVADKKTMQTIHELIADIAEVTTRPRSVVDQHRVAPPPAAEYTHSYDDERERANNTFTPPTPAQEMGPTPEYVLAYAKIICAAIGRFNMPMHRLAIGTIVSSETSGRLAASSVSPLLTAMKRNGFIVPVKGKRGYYLNGERGKRYVGLQLPMDGDGVNTLPYDTGRQGKDATA